MFARIMIIFAFVAVVFLFAYGKSKPRYSGLFGCCAVILCVLSLIFSFSNIKSQPAEKPSTIVEVKEKDSDETKEEVSGAEKNAEEQESEE